MKLLINKKLMNVRKSKVAYINAHEVSNTEAYYLNLILDKQAVWTEINIRSFRKLISRPSTNQELITDLFNEKSCEFDGWKITEEQTQKGIDYLRLLFFKKNGEERDTGITRTTSNSIIEAVRDFSHFSFVGLSDDFSSNFSAYKYYLPVYRIHTTTGLWVDYVYNPNGYGRGGAFLLVNHGQEQIKAKKKRG